MNCWRRGRLARLYNVNVMLTGFIRAVLCTTVLLLFASCDDSVSSKPQDREVVGVWKCKQLPEDFLRRAGESAAVVSSITFNADGTFVAKSFPDRDPYRLRDFQGNWHVTDPSMTPAGKWSVEIEGKFLRFARRGSKLVLKQLIDAIYEYGAEFEREAMP